MAPRLLLIIYIHGFKGDHTTFASFPAQLTALLSHRLPDTSIRHEIFPTFDTRGDLDATVQKFRSWLEEKVIDLEVELGTPSPTIDPGVGVLVIGHSMGGIVGAEAVLGIAGEKVLPTGSNGVGAEDTGTENTEKERVEAEASKEETSLLFPYIQGLLAFDTPYLGISPGVVAHGAEGHWNEGKAWYETAMGMFGAVAGGAAAKEAVDPPVSSDKALPAPDSNERSAQKGWQSKWGKTALIASAGLAATATLGTTAYLKRDTITSGFSWISSHLEFVGCLARGEELRRRLENMQRTSQKRDIGFTNFYTTLAEDKGGGKGGRTFCNVPKSGSVLWECFRPTRNEKAGDEAGAHVGMFRPKENPGYYTMSEEVLELIIGWIDKTDASVESAVEA